VTVKLLPLAVGALRVIGASANARMPITAPLGSAGINWTFAVMVCVAASGTTLIGS